MLLGQIRQLVYCISDACNEGLGNWDSTEQMVRPKGDDEYVQFVGVIDKTKCREHSAKNHDLWRDLNVIYT